MKKTPYKFRFGIGRRKVVVERDVLLPRLQAYLKEHQAEFPPEVAGYVHLLLTKKDASPRAEELLAQQIVQWEVFSGDPEPDAELVREYLLDELHIPDEAITFEPK